MGARQATASDGHVSAEDLFRQHAAFVARFLFRLGVRPDGIDDAVQEVFLVVHRQGGYRPGAAKPSSYLANLAVHAAAAYRRRERTRGAREVDAAIESVASTRSDPVEVLETRESLRRLQDALDRLEPELRTALVLVEIEGETCASIAAAMGIPVGTVYWRVHQARKKFQRALQAMEPAIRTHGALAVQAAGIAGGLKPERKERAGMLVLLMASPSWMNSEARDLLRLGASRPPVNYAVLEGLSRHRQLAASGAPVPSWANGLGGAATNAAWIAASLGAVAVVAVVALASRGGVQVPSRSAPQATIAVAAKTPTTGNPSTSAWWPVVTPNSRLAASSVPVEALPAAGALSAAAATRGAGSGDATRDSRVLAPDNPGLSDRVDPRSPVQADPPKATTDPSSDDELLELQQVARAERLVATDPARALALVRASESHFPNGYMRQERRYVEIIALIALGRLDEARPKIAGFLREYPESAFGQRIREAARRAHLEP
jgi:RNA polymerase sigma-70 factor (ECF subfamily)